MLPGPIQKLQGWPISATLLAVVLLVAGAGLNITAHAAEPPPAAAEAPPAPLVAPVVAAASDLKFALPELAKAFETETGLAVRLTFGSSGILATQIANGAPFELFLSADESYIAELERKGMLKNSGAVYALGNLSVFAPEGSAVTCDADLGGIRSVLISGSPIQIAIANPLHAPYGVAAMSALEAAGIAVDAKPRLLVGENVAQALLYATAGGAAVALVSAPLVEAPEFDGKGCHERVSERLVAPLRQRLALTKTAGAAAAQFAAFITSEKGLAVLARYGFSMPPKP